MFCVFSAKNCVNLWRWLKHSFNKDSPTMKESPSSKANYPHFALMSQNPGSLGWLLIGEVLSLGRIHVDIVSDRFPSKGIKSDKNAYKLNQVWVSRKALRCASIDGISMPRSLTSFTSAQAAWKIIKKRTCCDIPQSPVACNILQYPAILQELLGELALSSSGAA